MSIEDQISAAQQEYDRQVFGLSNAKKAGDAGAVQYIQQKALEAGTKLERLKMVQQMPTSERVLAGIGQGMTNVGRQVGNIFGLKSDEDLKQAAELDQPLLGTTSGKVGSFIGETAATLPAGGIAGQGAKLLGKNLAKNLIARGAAEGAIQGAVTAGPENRTSGAVLGGVAGTVLPAAGAAYRGIASGVPIGREARTLMNRGVDLTPGLVAPESSVNQIEQLASKVPFLGVKGKRDAAWKQTQQAIIDEVSPPNVKPPVYSDIKHSIDALQRKYNQEYDNLLGGFNKLQPVVLNTAGKSPQVKDVLLSGLKKFGNPNDEVTARKFLNNVLAELNQSKQQGYLSAKALQKARSDIRAAQFRQNKVGNDDLANIYDNAQKGITAVLDSQLPQDVMKALGAVDAQYGKFKIIESAQAAANEAVGGFTPAGFASAVKQSVPSKGQYAAGGGRLRDLSSAAYRTFTTMPQTGVQAIPGYASLAAGTTAAALAPKLAIPAALAAALAYTKPGMKVALGQTGIQEGMRNLSRSGRQAFTKDQREALARLLRTGSVNYMLGDQSGQEQ